MFPEKTAENRISVETGQTAPYDFPCSADQGADATITDQAKVKRAVHQTPPAVIPVKYKTL